MNEADVPRWPWLFIAVAVAMNLGNIIVWS